MNEKLVEYLHERSKMEKVWINAESNKKNCTPLFQNLW